MSAQQAEEFYQPETTTYRAQPCRDCGTQGGGRGRCRRPTRTQGYCERCYNRRAYYGMLPNDDTPPIIYASEEQMLWHTTTLVRQDHAVIAGYDAAAVAAEAEAFAAAWLARRGRGAVAWERPELARFGAA